MKVKDRGLPNRQSEGGDDFCVKTSVRDAKLIGSGGESGQAIKAVLVGHHAAFNSLGASITVTLAFGTPAPVGSVTIPVRSAEAPTPCAQTTGPAGKSPAKNTNRTARKDDFIAPPSSSKASCFWI